MRNSVIDIEDLHARLAEPGTVVLDCRFTLSDPGAGRRDYEFGHIPGARYVDLDRDLARRPGPHDGRHPLPAPETFAATLGRLGIDRATRVVAYDDASAAFAARAWWMLRWLGHADVSVLNGGLAAWREAGFPLESAQPQWTATMYAPWRADNDSCVATDDVFRLQAEGHVLLDARAAARFRGEVEPIDPVAGHVPGAVNLPFDRCLEADGRFLEPAAVHRAFATALDGRPAIAMCGSGVTACHLVLAMAYAGLPTAQLYVGSWSEWIRDPERPVAVGES